MENIRQVVRGKLVTARFRELAPDGSPGLAVPLYEQLDGHSCGFLAVLAVVRYFRPGADPAAVLRAVRPSADSGCDGNRVAAALAEFGVTAAYHQKLRPNSLSWLLAAGRPVAVTVWPEGYGCDHWAVVRGADAGGVYLANFGAGAVAWEDFAGVWYDYGEGIVCG